MISKLQKKCLMKNKTVYVPLAVDILHSAHIKILKKAKKYGKVIVGLLTDAAISEYKKLPLIWKLKSNLDSKNIFEKKNNE